MKIIELDLTGCSCLYDIHERIKNAFNFDNEYGHNWSAFWDMLWSECDADKIIIKGENTLPSELDETIAKLHEILERNKIERATFDWPFDYEIIC